MCSFEVRQLRSRQSKPDRACGSWFAINVSARRKRLDHLVHDGWRDAEEPLKVGFGRRPSMDLRLVVDEREILSLLRRERHCLARCRVGRLSVHWSQSASHALTDPLAP
jgi:hypothetical protein